MLRKATLAGLGLGLRQGNVPSVSLHLFIPTVLINRLEGR